MIKKKVEIKKRDADIKHRLDTIYNDQQFLADYKFAYNQEIEPREKVDKNSHLVGYVSGIYHGYLAGQLAATERYTEMVAEITGQDLDAIIEEYEQGNLKLH